MKKIFGALLLVILSMGMTACGSAGNGTPASASGENTPSAASPSTAETAGYENIKPEDAKKRLAEEEGIVLLDVRTQEEYAEKHIPGSLLIPVDVIEKEASSALTDKNAVIFVYCRSGRRSVIASEALVKMGYTAVYNLGGINDWPYETEAGK